MSRHPFKQVVSSRRRTTRLAIFCCSTMSVLSWCATVAIVFANPLWSSSRVKRWFVSLGCGCPVLWFFSFYSGCSSSVVVFVGSSEPTPGDSSRVARWFVSPGCDFPSSWPSSTSFRNLYSDTVFARSSELGPCSLLPHFLACLVYLFIFYRALL